MYRSGTPPAIIFYQSAFSSIIISEVRHKKSMPFLEECVMENKSYHSSTKKVAELMEETE